METTDNTAITVETLINASVEQVWKFFTGPEHIINWNAASGDWHTPASENDLRVGGKFKHTMAAKDGSMSFDFEGVYISVKENELIEYTIIDGRNVIILFTNKGTETLVTETFETENIHPPEIQRSGWQAILDNFKKYAEAKK